MLATTKKEIKKIAFFGDAEAKITDQHFIDAFNTAKMLAGAGYIIVNGGGPGVMRASTLGAKENNGRVEVVILDPKKQPDHYEGSDKENLKLADKIIKTNNYPDRLNKLVEVADAFVIFKGGTGTLSEVGLTWEMAKFEYGDHEPLIFFGNDWKNTVESLVDNLDFDKIEKKVYGLANTPEEVLKIIQNKKETTKEKNIGLFGRFKKIIDNF
jgi:uncharacterized protein (TIGR00725 family)